MHNNKLQKTDKRICKKKTKGNNKTSAADCNKITEKVLENKQTNVFENKLITNYYASSYLLIYYIHICMCMTNMTRLLFHFAKQW